MKTVFVVYTYYHLLISIITTLNSRSIEKKPNVLLMTRFKTNTDLLYKLMELSVFDSVMAFDEDELIDSNLFLPSDVIVMFNDSTLLGRYLRKNNLHYILSEDGTEHFRWLFQKTPIRSFIKYKLRMKYILIFQVNSRFGLPKFMNRNSIITNKTDLLSSLSNSQKSLVSSLFINESMMKKVLNKPNQIIFLMPSRRFYNDQSYNSLLNEVIRKFKNYTLIIKPHPGDSHLKSLSNDFVVIDSEFPIEILNYLVPNGIKIAIGSSWSIQNLYSVPIKYYV